MIGHEKGSPLNPFRKLFVTKPIAFLTRILGLISGVVWINIERPEICYKKYLGPDWIKQYKGAGTIVFNHITWLVNIFLKI